MSKRSACDRCRLQKLRCPPGGNGMLSCARCERLGAVCSLSSNFEPSGQMSGGPVSPPASSREAGNQINTPMTAPSTTRPPSAYHTTQSFMAHIHQPTNSLSASTESLHPFADDYMDVLGLSDIGNSFTDTSTYLSHEINSLPSPHSSTTPTGIDSRTDRMDVAQEAQELDIGMLEDEQSRNHSPSDCESRLMSLNMTLASRLQQCLAISWTSRDRPSVARLFEDALGDLSEFLDIIQARSASDRIPSQPHGPGVNRVSSIPSVNIVGVFNHLSAYFQIVAVYDKLLSGLCAQLCENSERFYVGYSAIPWAGSGSPQQEKLQTKILVHAILHQFETIERMLGLPVEIRVTDKRDAYSGLLRDERTRGLLEAVTHDGSSQGEIDDRSGMKALHSLRDATRRLQMSLGI